MSLAANVESLSGALPAISFRWDAETEILAGHFTGANKAGGLTGSVELEGSDGSFVVLDVAQGVVQGLEIVVWPPVETVSSLKVPAPKERGKLTMPARRSQPDIAAVEVETAISAEKTPDESTIHLRVGQKRPVTVTQLADNLILESDSKGIIAGFWLLNIPPFPVPSQ
ncbi:MAG TPA: hypothetical protein VGI83_01515 [Gemmatimonadales bacterium]|jgi:hypothetical protein